MGAYKDKNGTWYAQFRFTNWKGEPDRKTKRGFATKKEALDWERDFLTQSAGNLEMTFEAFYELYKKNLQQLGVDDVFFGGLGAFLDARMAVLPVDLDEVGEGHVHTAAAAKLVVPLPLGSVAFCGEATLCDPFGVP